MEFEYNDVHLEMTEIQSIRRETVWDDTHTHLLYVKWIIGVVAQYAPNGTPPGVSVTAIRTARLPLGIEALLRSSAAARAALRMPKRIIDLIRGKNATPTPVAQQHHTVVKAAGYGPLLTDVTLRARLMTPRKTLRITGYDHRTRTKVKLLESPKEGYAADPKNGPHPIALDIIDGNENSMAVFFQIETATLPCEDDSDRLVLSHTWETMHTHDEEMYLTRVIEGEVILNGAMVHTFGVYADQFRSQFFHPIPLGFQRRIPYIHPSSDGLSYKYRIEDTDPTVVFDAGDSGATHMEIAEKVGYSQPWKILGAVLP